MIKLTQAFVRRAKCPDNKRKIEFHDNGIRGFFLEIKASGTKSFYIRAFTNSGKRESIKLGDARVLSLEDARIKALKVKKAIEEKKDIVFGEAKRQQKKEFTLGQFYFEYYEPYVAKHIKSFETNISIFRNHLLPAFSNRKMSEIKKHEVMKLHADMVHTKGKKPATANKVLIFLSHIYNLAIELEIEGIEINPARGIKPFEANNQIQRFLTKKESERLLKSVKESMNPNLQYIVPMLILTGARRGEVLKAKWEDIDFIQGIWTIPTSKSGKKRMVPITKALKELLLSIPKEAGATYLFPSPKTNKPHTTIFNAWNKARERAGLKDVRLHDLRHTFASALVNKGRSLYEVQVLLGHSTAQMTQRYAHLSNEALMKAASCAAALV